MLNFTIFTNYHTTFNNNYCYFVKWLFTIIILIYTKYFVINTIYCEQVFEPSIYNNEVSTVNSTVISMNQVSIDHSNSFWLISGFISDDTIKSYFTLTNIYLAIVILIVIIIIMGAFCLFANDKIKLDAINSIGFTLLLAPLYICVYGYYYAFDFSEIEPHVLVVCTWILIIFIITVGTVTCFYDIIICVFISVFSEILPKKKSSVYSIF